VGDQINLWLHLLGMGTYFGSTLLLALMTLPAARRIPDAATRQTYLATSFKIYSPLTIAALGVQIMTGAFNLTHYKELLLGQYYSRFGYILAWKLGLVFILVMIATYVAFGIGLRIVRHEQWNEQLGAEKLEGMQRRLTAPVWLALFLTAAIVWVSLRMTAGVSAGP